MCHILYRFYMPYFLWIISTHMIRYSVFNVQRQIFATSCAHPFERIPKRLSKSRLILKGTTSFHSSEPLLASFLLISSGVSLSFFAIHSSSSSRWNCLFAFDHSSFVIFALFIFLFNSFLWLQPVGPSSLQGLHTSWLRSHGIGRL